MCGEVTIDADMGMSVRFVCTKPAGHPDFHSSADGAAMWTDETHGDLPDCEAWGR